MTSEALPTRRISPALCMAALLGGLILLLQTGLTQRLDVAVNLSLAPARTPWVIEFFLWITAFGSDAALWSMMAAATGLLWITGRAKRIRPLWITFIGTECTTWGLKFALARPRPVFLPDIATALSPSFPSAHSAGSMAVLGFFAVTFASLSLRVCMLCAIALIGLSRLVLNVHFPTDVIGGFLIGLLWLMIATPHPWFSRQG